MCYFIKFENVRPLTWQTFTVLIFAKDSFRISPKDL